MDKINYSKGGDECSSAWFVYKKHIKATTRPEGSIVDFVAGWNAYKEALLSVCEPIGKNDTITISKKEHEQFLENSFFLQCLQGAGVDNWEGYEFALEELNNE